MTATTPTPATARDDRRLLIRILEEAYRQSTWNGTNLRASLDHVPAGTASWRPPHARHSIAEIVLHSAYWKFAVRKRLAGDRGAAFPLDGKDWFDVPAPLDESRWAELVTTLDEEHRKLRQTIRDSEHDLAYGSRAGRELVRKLFGIAMHDAYHTGQIHLILAQHERCAKG
jgi:hypothetical protein